MTGEDSLTMQSSRTCAIMCRIVPPCCLRTIDAMGFKSFNTKLGRSSEHAINVL